MKTGAAEKETKMLLGSRTVKTMMERKVHPMNSFCYFQHRKINTPAARNERKTETNQEDGSCGGEIVRKQDSAWERPRNDSPIECPAARNKAI